MNRLFKLLLIPTILISTMFFQTLNDRSLEFNAIINQPKVVIITWATWCPSCKKVIKRVSDLQEFYPNIRFYYVNEGEKKEKVESCLKRLHIYEKIKDNVVLDEFGNLVKEYKIMTVPTCLFFKEGKLVKRSSRVYEKELSEL